MLTIPNPPMLNAKSVLHADSSALTTVNLAVGYTTPGRSPKVVVHDINVALKPGELVCLIGPNGAGKSTLMRTLAGMQPPLSGTITLGGDELRSLNPREIARRLSIVLTERVEVGILSAYALVALGRYPHTGWSGTLSPQDEAVVRWAIESVGASDLAARNVGELSDGERQKIMIARALAQQPAVMLLDEPTAFLDLPRRAEMMQLLRNLARETGKAILLSTHDLDLALRNADRMWLLPKGGSVCVGTPEDLVLTGAFEAAFQSEGVQFDPYTGSFRTAATPAGQVDLHGDGLPALWTSRALERVGYFVVRGGKSSPIRIDILQPGSQPLWQLTQSSASQSFTSLHDLILALEIDHLGDLTTSA